MDIAKIAVSLVFSAIIIITDYREYRIKNKSVIAFSAFGLLMNLTAGGLSGLLDSFLGLVIPLALLPLFALGMLGAGDVKALCALGSIAGWRKSVYIAAFSFVAGGVIAVFFMLLRKNALHRMKRFGAYVKQCFYTRSLLSYKEFTDEKSGFRFSLGIAAGYAAVVALDCLGYL